MALSSLQWGYVRIIGGTLLGGVLGFYLMHKAEISYKEKTEERLRKYQSEMKKRNEKQKSNELEDSL